METLYQHGVFRHPPGLRGLSGFPGRHRYQLRLRLGPEGQAGPLRHPASEPDRSRAWREACGQRDTLSPKCP
jgi:hypothetical protein